MLVRAQADLPIRSYGEPLQPLTELNDPGLQTRLELELQARPEWRNLIAEKKMAVGVVDLRDPDHARYAAINENHMMYAASLPKIAVLLSTMEGIERGQIKETPSLRKDMRLMISKSDNAASTRLIDKVGFEKIESGDDRPKVCFL